MKDLESTLEDIETEQILDELLQLEAAVKPLVKRIGEIKKWCKEKGSFSTLRFVCSVQGRSQKRLVGLEKAAETVGGEEALEELGLIQIIEFLTVHVSRKTSYNGSDIGL